MSHKSQVLSVTPPWALQLFLDSCHLGPHLGTHCLVNGRLHSHSWKSVIEFILYSRLSVWGFFFITEKPSNKPDSVKTHYFLLHLTSLISEMMSQLRELTSFLYFSTESWLFRMQIPSPLRELFKTQLQAWTLNLQFFVLPQRQQLQLLPGLFFPSMFNLLPLMFLW